jgi:hypothetical protein
MDEVLWQEIAEQFHDQGCDGPYAVCPLRWEHEMLATETMEILAEDGVS